jgi:hypothetical protein
MGLKIIIIMDIFLSLLIGVLIFQFIYYIVSIIFATYKCLKYYYFLKNNEFIKIGDRYVNNLDHFKNEVLIIIENGEPNFYLDNATSNIFNLSKSNEIRNKIFYNIYKKRFDKLIKK